MIRLRHQVAVAIGPYNSHADRVLRDKMAGNQENVFAFLHQLQQHVTPHYQRDLTALLRMKQKNDDASNSSIFNGGM